MPAAVLSPFQREKLRYYFNFFDADGDGHLMKKDLPVLFKKILEYTGWAENSPAATELYEVHETFFEVLYEKTDVQKDRVEIDDWMSLWEHMIPGCMGMHNFPIWLRLLPRSLFRVMDTNDDGLINANEIQHFYESFVKIPEKEVGDLATRAYNEMTDFGRYPLTLEGYEQIFANFLLGRTKYGPGRFIFGCFEHSAEEQAGLISGPPKEGTVLDVTTKSLRRSGDAIRTPMRMYRKE
ncbi:sarcoplasmic calcium-binding proteins I, III, and IV-like [Mizuhopecten yessoensis]|uniref:Sarcoplasmic calcium-binding proteins I, III, and IV n=1 Tax=Mizuhopecten yessoensis TaxID=6573 RepID=A0A210PN13_MIZYE|nr:sarcoplasmic calcium-binding proteins I, III, and IV-like [Mizuhopecten yessoensis]OWF37900.1 Sarcoplasmic calcium-binding proteins I, III, and IV [Mizuhopecten yessoensis]